nr:hypothetical protein BgiMline_019721 [Biomphalaria glabrata]
MKFALLKMNKGNEKRFQSLIENYRSSRFEDEICLNPLTDLQKYYDDCEKDPGHRSFKSCEDFRLTDIPVKYRSVELLNLIRTLFILTVQVMVTSISPDRPREQSLHEIYEASCGVPPVRFGSGKISKIKEIIGRGKNTCPCKECLKSVSPKKKWYHIEVITAKHVVNDALEAMNTTCTFGYISYACKGQSFSCVGARVSPNSDWCKLTCVTHDEELAAKIKDKICLYDEMSQNFYVSYRTSKKNPKLAIIISHPHGCYKQISIGYWRKRAQAGGLDTKYTYTTSTCNGSSGAPVYILGRDGRLGLCTHIHSGWDPESPLKDNFSCCVFDSIQ